MQKILTTLNLTIISLIVLPCCNFKSTTRNTNTNPGASSGKKQEIVSTQIIKGTLKSKTGDVLSYTFDNNLNTMNIVFNNETIKLKRELTASGIKYSNENYIYTEWHGISRLQKNGNIVFEGSKND